MKILLYCLFILAGVTSLAQIEEFDTHSADTIFNERHLPIEISHKDYNGDKVGITYLQYFDNDSLSEAASSSEKGIIHYQYNENGDVIFKQIDHYSRLKAHYYYDYKYSESGLMLEKDHYDSTLTLLYMEEFDYYADTDSYLQTRTYNHEGKVYEYANYNYSETGVLQYIETFSYLHFLIKLNMTKDFSVDNMDHEYSYSYGSNGELVWLRCIITNKYGSNDTYATIKFQYKEGVLYSFTEDQEDPVKVKRNQDHLWVVAHAFATERTKNQQED